MRICKIHDEYLFIAPIEMTVEKVLEKINSDTGMRKGSYADCFVKLVFGNLLKGADNLRYFYDRYYSMEYDDFKTYLYCKEMFEDEEIQQMNLADNESVWRLESALNSYSTTTIFGYEDENLEIFNNYLETL